MLKKPNENEILIGNNQYEGFCIDLLKKIATMCNFTYTIQLVSDGFYGSIEKDQFNGLVAELIRKVKLKNQTFKHLLTKIMHNSSNFV